MQPILQNNRSSRHSIIRGLRYEHKQIYFRSIYIIIGNQLFSRSITQIGRTGILISKPTFKYSHFIHNLFYLISRKILGILIIIYHSARYSCRQCSNTYSFILQKGHYYFFIAALYKSPIVCSLRKSASSIWQSYSSSSIAITDK